jgi:hypothetical protein
VGLVERLGDWAVVLRERCGSDLTPELRSDDELCGYLARGLTLINTRCPTRCLFRLTRTNGYATVDSTFDPSPREGFDGAVAEVILLGAARALAEAGATSGAITNVGSVQGTSTSLNTASRPAQHRANLAQIDAMIESAVKTVLGQRRGAIGSIDRRRVDHSPWLFPLGWWGF